MTRQNAPVMISIHDPLLVMLKLMRTFVTSVLGEYIGQARLCVVYGSTCPCERVVVATHNLAVI
jgi:hypothetical protein